MTTDLDLFVAIVMFIVVGVCAACFIAVACIASKLRQIAEFLEK